MRTLEEMKPHSLQQGRVVVTRTQLYQDVIVDHMYLHPLIQIAMFYLSRSKHIQAHFGKYIGLLDWVRLYRSPKSGPVPHSPAPDEALPQETAPPSTQILHAVLSPAIPG